MSLKYEYNIMFIACTILKKQKRVFVGVEKEGKGMCILKMKT